VVSPRRSILLSGLSALWAVASATGSSFQLPTANHALFEKGGEEKFFAGTTGKPWTTGTFGCVRTDGRQFHEGLDIRSLTHDKRGEPTDEVKATAEGTVAYISRHPSLSNYGNYIVLRHQVDGVEIYSLYAHLHEIRAELKPGQAVKSGETIAIMGRTANTHEGISKDRAHVHFELNLLANEHYAAWHKKALIGQKNDHGDWNGQNLLGLDPRAILLQQQTESGKFNLLKFIQHQTELCRVQIRQSNLSWAKRYPALVQPNLRTAHDGIAGYELCLNFNGIPFEIHPLSSAELKGKGKVLVTKVNEAEQQKDPCGHLISKRGKEWELTHRGAELIDLLAF
jgi:murein DD-endopeptidase MepM/ murein hydrolase activator NlpD